MDTSRKFKKILSHTYNLCKTNVNTNLGHIALHKNQFYKYKYGLVHNNHEYKLQLYNFLKWKISF